jgi:hypothetical protein
MKYTEILNKRILLTLGSILVVGYSFSTDFTDKQKAVIYNEAIKTLQSYQQYTNQMADEVVDMAELNKTSQKLIDLFVSRKSIIYNDLDPAHKLSEAYELETYVTNMLLWYPDGMKITLDFDNLRAGNIISHGNDIYTVDIMTSKRIDGNYLNQQKNTLKEELLFRIAFFQKNNAFENYRIAGVRSSKATAVTDDSRLLAEVKSIAFSEKDIQLINDQTKSLLNDYINFLKLLTDPKETNEDKAYYGISFLGLFKDSTINVANDIEPDPSNRWLKIKEYQRSVVTSYPEGIRNIGMNIDSAKYGKVIAEGNEKYYINGYIDKFFSGKYLSKTVFRDNSKYDFKVSFERNENTFINFKLASIDKFGVNLYSQNAANGAQELPQNPISTLQRKGLYFGLAIGGGVTNFKDDNLTSNSILTWTNKGKRALNILATATYYVNNRIGLTAGIGYSSYSANANLNGSFRNTNYSTDINNELYLKIVSAAYDSSFTLNYITIPLGVLYHTNKNTEKWGVYIEAGLLTSINITSNFNTTGNIATSGYYEQHAGLIITDPGYGFTNRTGLNIKGKSDISTLNFALITSIGVSYPINYFTTAFIGPEVTFNLNSIAKAKTSTDAFGNTTTAKNVAITKYGIKFGISYKF